MRDKCPGQDRRNIKAELIKCPSCGYNLEIFSDEVKIKCPRCKDAVYKKGLPSCVDWCNFAKECTGELSEAKNDKG